jgi:ribonuclease D
LIGRKKHLPIYGLKDAKPLTITLHKNDLPASIVDAACQAHNNAPMVAIDCETMGLNPHRDRLCLVQLSFGDGDAHLIQVPQKDWHAPVLARLVADPAIVKIYHFGRFDIAALYQNLGVMSNPNYCTKIASRLIRTYTDRHSLKELTRELLGIDLSKEQQSSDWGQDTLTQAQMNYAASDVLHLHAIKQKLDLMLVREGRAELAQACFDFLSYRAKLDLQGWPDIDIFAH